VSYVEFGIMSAFSPDGQRVKRLPGVDAQDLEDSVGAIGDDFQRTLVSNSSCASQWRIEHFSWWGAN